MIKPDLAAECLQLKISLSRANAKVLDLQQKINDKNIQTRRLKQQVHDTKKKQQKLQTILDNLQEERYISAEIAEILKVKKLVNNSSAKK